MSLSKKEILDLEKKAVELRKTVIIEKMEAYYEYAGINGGDCFMQYLKENCNFKYGSVIDFENFKKEYLTTTKRLTEFNGIFFNSGFDYDEFFYLGFEKDLTVVDETAVYEVFYNQIRTYEFSNEDLTLFEDFVDYRFNQVFDF